MVTVVAAGSVRQLSGGRWRITVSAGVDPVSAKRRQVVRHVRGSRDEAEIARAQLLIDVGRGEHVGHDGTLDDLIDARLRVAKLSPSTRRDYGYARRHVGALGAMPLWKVRASHLDELYARLDAAGLGPDRIRRVHGILRRSFAQAVKWGWIARNPAVDASPPPPGRAEIVPPSVTEVQRVLARADGDLLAYLRLEVSLGARRGEMLALRWGDVDLAARSVLVHRALVDGGRGVGLVAKGTKTGRRRTPVALDDATVAVLREHRSRAIERALAAGVTLGADAYVFARDPAGASPWRPDSTSRRFRHLCDGLGLDHVRLHDLRHFVATQMIAAGIDIRTVSNRLGHARTSTTLDMYAAAVPAADRAAVDLLAHVLDQRSVHGA